MTIAAKLRTLRESAGLTAADLAALAGLHVRTLNQIEQGKRPNPGLATMQAVCKALGVSLSEFDLANKKK